MLFNSKISFVAALTPCTPPVLHIFSIAIAPILFPNFVAGGFLLNPLAGGCVLNFLGADLCAEGWICLRPRAPRDPRFL